MYIVSDLCSTNFSKCFLRSWWKAAFKSATPLLLLGFARLASTLSLDYQVEYISLRWTFCNNSCLQWNRISCVLYLLANIKQMELWEMSKIMLQTSLYSKAFCIISIEFIQTGFS